MAISFRPYQKNVGDALIKVLREEFPGIPILFVDPENYRAKASPHFGLIPGNSSVVQSYAGGSLREYEFAIRYYTRKPRLDNFRTSIFEIHSDLSERIIRLIDSKNKHEDENVYFSNVHQTFSTVADDWDNIISYRWHNGKIEAVDFDPSRTTRENKRDLQIMELLFTCNVMELKN